MSDHTYTVELRILGNDIEPDSITQTLGLQPCHVVYPGSKRRDGRPVVATWAYNGTQQKVKNWDSLEEGLAFVLAKVLPHRESIAAYKDHGRVVWWCGHFQSSFDGGPSLSPDLLKRLGEFGAELLIDNYLSGPEFAGPPGGSERQQIK